MIRSQCQYTNPTKYKSYKVNICIHSGDIKICQLKYDNTQGIIFVILFYDLCIQCFSS